MSPFTLLYTILIRPIQLVFEILFMIANRLLGHPGLAIIALSLAMNFLVLPLYRRADAMQEEARDMDRRLRRGVGHIKKTFSGDEKMMILQTYYRQNRYAPTDALKGSVSLLLEIPFFIAAYQFLSHLKELNGISFGPIADLAAPDALLQLGGLSVNLLPILMTLINVISSAIFLKGFPLKSKIQLYGMALFFLVFLYNSPSGLVFYWTLNNLFSLVKTIFYKIPNPRKVLAVLCSLAGLAAMAGGVLLFGLARPKLLLACLLLGLCLQLPLLARHFGGRQRRSLPDPNRRLFLLSTLLMALLTGLLIPSAVLAASPLDFINPNYYHNPLRYLLMSSCLAAGSFLLWFRIFYGLAADSGKVLLERLLFAAALLMPANYLFFGTGLGKLSSALQYEEFWDMRFGGMEQLVNLGVLLLLFVGAWLLVTKKAGLARALLLTLCLALCGMSALNVAGISRSVRAYRETPSQAQTETPELRLSREGKNVVILMLDRAYGGYIPYFLEEKPELKEQFDGFTWYSDVLSFGGCTNFGIPPVYGGYEYTPVEMNKRSEETLVSKHNEAVKVLPALFYEEGYEVTVCDTPYANYKNIPDMSIYDEYEGMKTLLLRGAFTEPAQFQAAIESNYRNFFCFSLMKCAPLFLQDTLYQAGNYNQARGDYAEQVIEPDIRAATGLSGTLTTNYNVLTNLSAITTLSDDEQGSFLLLSNETTHNPALLQLPDYSASPVVDNREIPWESPVVDGKPLPQDTPAQTTFYHVNMGALLRVGEWLDTLRELGVYDNTRILVVSDHGNDFLMMDDLMYRDFPLELDVARFYPLLMVKDFDSHGFTICEDFMTNADVPALAVEGLMDDPRNPFTGKAISMDAKYAGDQYIITAYDSDVERHTGSQFVPAYWFSVHDSIFDPANWSFYDYDVLPRKQLS